jgi:transposase
MAQVLEHSRSQVMIAVDPHKASWTAAAVDASLQLLATVRVPVSDAGYRELRRFARKWSNTHWAKRGCRRPGSAADAPLGR